MMSLTKPPASAINRSARFKKNTAGLRGSVMDKSKHYIQSGRETVSGAVDASKQAYRNAREGTRNDFNDRPRD